MIAANLKNFFNIFRNRPILCNYYVTYRCNARCVFCDFWRRTDYKHTPDARLEDVLSNLRALRKEGVIFVDFTGGEPLLNHELPAMLAEAKRLGFVTSVTTNTLLYEKRAADIRGLVDILHFSLDSLDPRKHNALRGLPIFNSVMKSIRLAKSLGERPDLLVTVTEANYRELPRLVAFAQKERLMLVTNPVFSYFGNRGTTEEVIRFVEKFQHEPFVYVNRAFHQLIRAGGNRPERPRCRGVSSTVVISPQNELLLPCFHRRNQAVPVRGDLGKALRSPERRQALKMQGRYPFCKNCTINCYFDPSFLYVRDRYFFLSLVPKMKYAFDRNLRPKLSAVPGRRQR